MKQKFDFKSFALGIAITGILAFSLGAVENKNASFIEHKVIISSPLPSDHPSHVTFAAGDLNTYAAEGWEVVCSHLFNDQETLKREVVLKRTKNRP